MSTRILVLVSWLFAAGVVVVVGGFIVLGVLAATGDFGKQNECADESAAGAAPRGVSTDLTLASQWDSKWDSFSNTLDSGGTASVSFTESEVTSRADKFLKDKHAPLDEVIVCFHEGSGE